MKKRVPLTKLHIDMKFHNRGDYMGRVKKFTYEVMEDSRFLCVVCADHIDPRRAALGYKLCLWCGEDAAKAESRQKASMVQIPYSKGAYQYIYDPADLIGTNPKRTT